MIKKIIWTLILVIQSIILALGGTLVSRVFTNVVLFRSWWTMTIGYWLFCLLTAIVVKLLWQKFSTGRKWIWSLYVAVWLGLVIVISVSLWSQTLTNCLDQPGYKNEEWEILVKIIPRDMLDKFKLEKRSGVCGTYLVDTNDTRGRFIVDRHLYISVVNGYPREKVEKILDRERLKLVTEISKNKYLVITTDQSRYIDPFSEANYLRTCS